MVTDIKKNLPWIPTSDNLDYHSKVHINPDSSLLISYSQSSFLGFLISWYKFRLLKCEPLQAILCLSLADDSAQHLPFTSVVTGSAPHFPNNHACLCRSSTGRLLKLPQLRSGASSGPALHWSALVEEEGKISITNGE